MVKNMYYIFLGLQATVAAAPMIGYLPGGLIFGTMSDKIGRKPTFLICNAVGMEFYTKTSSKAITTFLDEQYISLSLCSNKTIA